LPTIGSVVWLVAGRPRAASIVDPARHAGAGPQGFTKYERLDRAMADNMADTTADDAEFLRQCRERAQEQRRRYQQRQRDDQE
jgi:hypothetical protein